MALEQISLGPGPVDGGADGRQRSGDGGEGSKVPRLPRWNRQEILVLIRGKRAVEGRVRSGRASGSGPVQAEPKWESVASYCRRHGVNRGPVQCRKRWSNLAADFKKIKEWESSARAAGNEAESFWAMRNDLRRERKLPGFFDREVYDILDGVGGEEASAAGGGGGLSLALAPATAAAEEGGEEAEPEVLFDSGRSAAADDGLFSDSERPDRIAEGPGKGIPDLDPISVSEEQEQTFREESSGKGKDNEKQPEPEAEDQGTQGKKRKRNTADQEDVGTANLEHQLIEALDKNGELLSSLLESQNTHLQLDRQQRDDHVSGLLTVLNKLADALARIADKL